jgi:hypothetical protein
MFASCRNIGIFPEQPATPPALKAVRVAFAFCFVITATAFFIEKASKRICTRDVAFGTPPRRPDLNLGELIF